MPLKLNIGLSRKVGLPDYGSLGASCSIEQELDSGLITRDPVGLGDRARQAYAACAEAVDEALRHHRPADFRQSNDGSQKPRSSQSTHHSRHRPATARQLEYARQLATQIPGMEARGIQAWTQENWGKLPGELSRAEASQLIDSLQALLSQELADRQVPATECLSDDSDGATLDLANHAEIDFFSANGSEIVA